jgi:mRNA interferase MazF
MNKPTKIYEPFDIVVVPFPFIDIIETKKRPAIIISSSDSFNRLASAYVLAMITSATHSKWPCDVEILDLKASGLPVKSIIRMKLFTLDSRLILRQLGTLSKKDQSSLRTSLKTLLP